MFDILFLGTSASVPTLGRSLPATLVRHQGQRFLVDCGEGAQLRLLQAKESLKVSHVLLTHDHLDHILGLAGLLFSLSLLRMMPPPLITVYGGNTTLARVRGLTEMIRSEPGAPMYFDLVLKEIEPGVILENDQLVVTAFPTEHRPQRPSFGYIFQSKGKDSTKLVFTGDTRYTSDLVTMAQEADCLVTESNFAHAKESQAQKVGHLTATQAAMIANQAHVRMLALTHVSREYADKLDSILAEAKAIFPNTLLPGDLDRLTVTAETIQTLPKGSLR